VAITMPPPPPSPSAHLVPLGGEGVVVELADDGTHGRVPDGLDRFEVVGHLEKRLVRVLHLD
jgi:hypothetical protein